MPVCTVMVGLPALGKSTYIQRIATHETWVYSTDDYIEAYAEEHGTTYNKAFELAIKLATKANNDRLEQMIDQRVDVIWDQTNLTPRKRKSIIDRMSAAGYEVNCVCLMPPTEADDDKVWKTRLAQRPGKVIPPHILSSMEQSFVVPSLEEGFNRIEIYDIRGIQLHYTEK